MEEIVMTASENRKYNRRRLKQKHIELRFALRASENLDTDVKRVWLEALRSGEYKQGRGTMCRVDDNGAYSFCCLGVLADETIDTDWYPLGAADAYTLGHRGPWGGLGHANMKTLGLSLSAQAALAKANDSGLRFSSIAKAIEECL